MPFEGCSDEQAREWAEKLYEKLPKCQECGDLLRDERERYGNDYSFMWGDRGERYPFCSQYCAEEDYRKNEELNDVVQETE
jgi:hypothetical protein